MSPWPAQKLSEIGECGRQCRINCQSRPVVALGPSQIAPGRVQVCKVGQGVSIARADLKDPLVQRSASAGSPSAARKIPKFASAATWSGC